MVQIQVRVANREIAKLGPLKTTEEFSYFLKGSKMATSILVTDVGDEMSWRQINDVGDEMSWRQL